MILLRLINAKSDVENIVDAIFIYLINLVHGNGIELMTKRHYTT